MLGVPGSKMEPGDIGKAVGAFWHHQPIGDRQVCVYIFSSESVLCRPLRRRDLLGHAAAVWGAEVHNGRSGRNCCSRGYFILLTLLLHLSALSDAMLTMLA